MLTPAQLTQMDRDGLVTVDSGFTPDEVARGASAADRLFENRADGFLTDFLDPDLLHLTFHPLIERFACQMLRTDHIGLRGVALRKTAPRQDQRTGLEGEHADIRYTLQDWEATPRRVLCTILIWLTDVTELRAPFMFRPGTHRTLAAHYDGVPAVFANNIEKMPKLDWPPNVPALAKAGQISVGSTGVLHSGSYNRDTTDRKVIFLQYQARGIPAVKFHESHQPSMDLYGAKLRAIIPQDRHKLIWIGEQG